MYIYSNMLRAILDGKQFSNTLVVYLPKIFLAKSLLFVECFYSQKKKPINSKVWPSEKLTRWLISRRIALFL